MSKEWEKKRIKEQKFKRPVNLLPIPFDNIHLCVERKTNMHLINFYIVIIIMIII